MRYIRTIQEMIDMQVSETISRIDPITEMAVPLKKYKVRVDGLKISSCQELVPMQILPVV